jgi:hypothetical protein
MNVMTAVMNGVRVMDKESTDIDWAYQNALREQWLKNNPDSCYIGWMSI